MSQKTTAVKREDDAYTSPSTAENQKVSEKVYANAPTAPAPRRAMPRVRLIGDEVKGDEAGFTNLHPNAVIVQKRKRIVNAEANAERALTHIATCVVSAAKSEKKRPMSMKKGAPGG